MTKKEEYLQLIYSYLYDHNILDIYLHEVKKGHSLRSSRGDIIDNTLSWSSTPQGHDFWSRHNSELIHLLRHIDRNDRAHHIETVDYLENINIIRPYEFW